MSYKVIVSCPFGDAELVLDCKWNGSGRIMFSGSADAVNVAKTWLSLSFGVFGHFIDVENCSPQDLHAASQTPCAFVDTKWDGQVEAYDAIPDLACS